MLVCSGMPRAESRHITLKAIVARLRQKRLDIGWSRYKLANESGVSLPGICLIEDGKREPGLVTLFLLADAMDVRLGDFINDCDDRKN